MKKSQVSTKEQKTASLKPIQNLKVNTKDAITFGYPQNQLTKQKRTSSQMVTKQSNYSVKYEYFSRLLSEDKIIEHLLKFFDLNTLNKFCYLSRKTRISVKSYIQKIKRFSKSFTFDISKFLNLKESIQKLCSDNDKEYSKRYLKQFTSLSILQKVRYQVVIQFGQLIRRKQKSALELLTPKSLFKTVLTQYHRFILQLNREKIANSIQYFYTLKKSNCVFNYLNKNIFGIILTFLDVKDILTLMLVNKKMRVLTEKSKETVICYYKNKQQTIAQKQNIDISIITAVEYFAHYELFQEITHGKFYSLVYNSLPEFREMVKLSQELTSESRTLQFKKSLNYTQYKYQHTFFRIKFTEEQSLKLKKFLQSTSFEILEQKLIELQQKLQSEEIQYKQLQSSYQVDPYVALIYRYLQCLDLMSDNFINRIQMYNNYQLYKKFLQNTSKHLYFLQRVYQETSEKFPIYLTKNYPKRISYHIFIEPIINIFSM